MINLSKKSRIFSYLVICGAVSGYSSVSLADASSIQNISPYTFSLVGSTPTGAAACTSSCAATLLPQAVQGYTVTGADTLVLDYDVLKAGTKLGHITLTLSANSVQVTNGLGGTVTSGISAAQINYNPPTALWQGEFTNLGNWATNNWKVDKTKPNWGAANIEVRASTVIDPSPRKENYLRIHYPSNSANPGSSPPLPLGGTQFYAALLKTDGPITLSYYVRFPTIFPFTSPQNTSRPVTVGKLPGLYAGAGNTGSVLPTGYDGWTIRFMWCDYAVESGAKYVGGGEVVQFTYGSNLAPFGTDKGKFIGCGTWKFAADNQWHNIQQTVHMNDAGKSNGRVDVCYDGKWVYSITNVTFRLSTALKINGILFQSFFGGSGSDYSTPKSTYADFGAFSLYSYPATANAGLCIRNATL